jgi:TRAP-type transport system small permease protein
MTTLAVVVILGVVFRKAGAALVWYDEVASILLAWLTFYGAALAALKRAHIGFPKIVESLSGGPRKAVIIFAEILVVGFMLVVIWAGWEVFGVLQGETLVSLPWLPQRVVQSAVPIGAALFVVAEFLTLPDRLRGDPAEAIGP